MFCDNIVCGHDEQDLRGARAVQSDDHEDGEHGIGRYAIQAVRRMFSEEVAGCLSYNKIPRCGLAQYSEIIAERAVLGVTIVLRTSAMPLPTHPGDSLPAKKG